MARLWGSASATTQATTVPTPNKSKPSATASSTTTAPPPTSPPLRPRSTSRTDEETRQLLPQSPRRRLNSRDISRSYSGLYGLCDDLLPFELNRKGGGSTTIYSWQVVASTYAVLLALLQLVALWLCPLEWSWTLTNAVHLAITILTVHWLKGSLTDEQGELNALTVWEQLEATHETRPIRRVLLVVPTILTYLACHFSNYNPTICLINVALWMVAVLAKLPFMNGVRIFGINRTVGIDDDDEQENDMASSNTKKQQ